MELVKTETPQTLPALIAQSLSITQAIIESGGELTPELELTFDQGKEALAVKVQAYALVMDQLEHQEGLLRKRASEYTAAARACGNAVENMKARLKYAMQQLGEKELIGGDTKFVLQRTQPKLIINQEELAPEYLMQVTEVVPDKERIEQVLKEGFDVPGAKYEENFSLVPRVNTKKGK